MKSSKLLPLVFLKGILAGLAIGLGGFLFVIASAYVNKLLGSIVFAVGLFLVCFFKFELYTGKIGFAFDMKRKSYVLDLIVMLLGNVAGAYLLGFLIRLTPIMQVEAIAEKINAVAAARLVGVNETFLQAFISSIFCGALVFLAVYYYKNNKHFIFKVLALVICVAIFVYFGFEHVIANIFYFSFAGTVSVHAIVNLFICLLGNSIGALILRLNFYLLEKLK